MSADGETARMPSDSRSLLAAYDAQLRGAAEVPGARSWIRIGPVVAARYAAGRGFVTYGALTAPDGAPLDAARIATLVHSVIDHFESDPGITHVEWKTRGHDHAPGLVQALLGAGFGHEETESIMVGEAATVAVPVPLPCEVTLRRVSAEVDVRRMTDMQAEVFGESVPGMADELLRRLVDGGDDLELWIAETSDGAIVCAGRLEPVPGTQFAGLWGGCTRPEWRGRGIYRALTAQRARSALSRGKRYLHSDSTEYSRPILQRAGLIEVGTTTPYLWRRAGRHRYLG